MPTCESSDLRVFVVIDVLFPLLNDPDMVDEDDDTVAGSSDLDRGLPGPRLTTGAGGGIVDVKEVVVVDDDLPSHETLARLEEEVRCLGDGDCDESLVVTAVESEPFSPFFFLVVKVMGLSSVYMTVGFRCLFDTL